MFSSNKSKTNMETLPKCIIPWLYLEIFPDRVVTP